MTMFILLIVVPIILGMIAQARVWSAFNYWKSKEISSHLTGAEIARKILAESNIQDVEVLQIQDALGDHYDPVHKRLCLSPEVYSTNSVAAAGIAAHECGHAIQHKQGYALLNARMLVVPTTQFASQMLPVIIILGAIMHSFHLMILGAACFAVIAAFNLITLPVEFDASKRAKESLAHMNILSQADANGVNKVLNAAALTYVAAFVAALGNLLYFLLASRR